MRRRAAIFWHAALSLAAGALYFGFVLPRWWELMGDTSHGLGTVARIAAGILIALAALPVVFTLLELRKPEFGTPALALNLRTWSVVAHVAAGVLIVGTAISEIWLSLDNVGQWLFGVYGAAAAVALLGIAGFYLSFVAELPPPPPKPLKPRREKGQRRRRGKKDADVADVADDTEDAEVDDAEAADNIEDAEVDDSETEAVAEATNDDSEASEDSTDTETTVIEPESTAEEVTPLEDAEGTDTADDAAESGGLRNRRPSGKREGTHRRRRSRRGVAVDE
jgi:hypothetical protein